jgi:hypothetical protein
VWKPFVHTKYDDPETPVRLATAAVSLATITLISVSYGPDAGSENSRELKIAARLQLAFHPLFNRVIHKPVFACLPGADHSK